eukprot:COSAG03_NODE_15088_length_441_cov_1.157895_1_plen_68_part_01
MPVCLSLSLSVCLSVGRSVGRSVSRSLGLSHFLCQSSYTVALVRCVRYYPVRRLEGIDGRFMNVHCGV